jgi:transcriptional regulator with XRE-family HTH domain
MPESRISRADRRSSVVRSNVGSELRVARASAGLTLDQVAHAVGISASELSRIERGLAGWVGLATLNRIASIVGIDLWVRTYPGGEPLRDLAHLRLTQAFTELVGPSLSIRGEVSIGDARDQRAWDLTLTDPQHRVCGTELETRLVDAQSQMRRINKKRTDSNVDRLLVVLADTRLNRSALRAAAALMATDLSIDDTAAYAALRRGELPPRDALILVRSATSDRLPRLPCRVSRRRELDG